MIADGGRKIRFPDEQKLHVTYFHPEVMDDPDKLEVTLQKPELIAKGATEDTKIYYKFFGKTPVGAKYLAVVVKLLNGEGFIVTAYFTERVKRNKIAWRRES